MTFTSDINPTNYYGCALDLDVGDKRHAKYQEQRRGRGFDDSETWNLQVATARFVLPRLKRFKEVNNGFPSGMTEESWDAALDEMIFALQAVAEDGNWAWPRTLDEDRRRDRVVAGVKLFGEHLLDLWW